MAGFLMRGHVFRRHDQVVLLDNIHGLDVEGREKEKDDMDVFHNIVAY